MNPLEKVKIAVEALKDKKASDIRVLDIGRVSVLADYFVIASGSNKNQVQAMTDNVEEKLAEQKIFTKHVEGYVGGRWILLDYGDVIIHLFDEEDRIFYDLEKIWRDGTEVDI